MEWILNLAGFATWQVSDKLLDSRVSRRMFSRRTLSAMRHDLLRLRARVLRKSEYDVVPSVRRLHLGCGSRLVSDWLNVDVVHSDYDVDLACGRLPWRSGVFDTIVSEHFIEHLELDTELMSLLAELHRVLRPGGEIWLSCPDMEKVCASYLYNGMVDLFEDRRTRWPDYGFESVPITHMLNDLFHQGGEHKNLYDFTLLSWALRLSSFTDVARVREGDLLRSFPRFPVRNDDAQSLYVRAVSAPVS